MKNKKESFQSESFHNVANKITSNPSICTTIKNGVLLSKEICTICKKDFLVLTYDDVLKYYEYLTVKKRAYSTCIRKFRNLSALSAYLEAEKSSLNIPRTYSAVITMDFFFEKFGRRTTKNTEMPKDLTGRTFDQLKVKEYFGKNRKNERLYQCECNCGGSRIVNEFHLIYGDVTNCGNSENHPSGTDLKDQTFGFLKVLTRDSSEKNGQAKWMVRCGLCGKITSVSARNLLYGNTISCGCLQGKSRKYIDMLLENKEKYIIYW